MLWLRSVATILLLTVAALGGCSRQNTLTSDDIRSEVLAVTSFTSQIEMFIDFVRQGRATKLFVQGHTKQLERELSRNAQQLDDSIPSLETQRDFQKCKDAVGLLRGELSLIPQLINNDAGLQTEREHLERIRERLTNERSPS